jgi:hypothetical protein
MHCIRFYLVQKAVTRFMSEVVLISGSLIAVTVRRIFCNCILLLFVEGCGHNFHISKFASRKRPLRTVHRVSRSTTVGFMTSRTVQFNTVAELTAYSRVGVSAAAAAALLCRVMSCYGREKRNSGDSATATVEIQREVKKKKACLSLNHPYLNLTSFMWMEAKLHLKTSFSRNMQRDRMEIRNLFGDDSCLNACICSRLPAKSIVIKSFYFISLKLSLVCNAVANHKISFTLAIFSTSLWRP